MKVGETEHVTATGLTLEGDGVAHVGGRELLCAGLFPDEVARVRVTALSRHNARAHGRLLALDRPHAGRRAAPCSAHWERAGRCTGCALMSLDEAAQRELKRVMLEGRFGLTVASVEPSSADLGYRWSSKRVAFANERGALTLGSYVRGTHDPAAMEGCLVDHPRLVEAFAEVEQQARTLGIAPYTDGSGDLRYVWAKTNEREVLITLVVLAEQGRAARELANALRVPSGVLVSVQDERGNSLRGKAPTLVRGQREISTQLLGQTVEVGALGFMQPNPRVAVRAYEALVGPREPERAELAFDLYAGAGITTRALSTRYRKVVACEVYPESAALLGVPAESSEVFLARWLGEGGSVPDLVVANPPRKGLGERACELLAQLAAPEIRIMSCGPEGLARDLTQLARHGYQTVELRAFDTLPQTPHVELVARLRRP